MFTEKGKLRIIATVTKVTRTAWAVFKYCGTKTATLGLSMTTLY